MITTYEEGAKVFGEFANNFNSFLYSVDVLSLSQFTIDLVEELQSDIHSVVDKDGAPYAQFADTVQLLGATCYDMENVLEIMDEALPDYKAVQSILAECSKHNEIKYEGLL